eukprot:9794267-Ditylum_brightwellii.AAC.2
MVWGSREEVLKESEQFNNRLDCNDIGKVKEYVGCEINIDEKERNMTFTQPVLLQSFEDEFELPERKAKTPAETVSILVKAGTENKVNGKRHSYFRSGTGSAPVDARIKAMHRVMGYSVSTQKQGWKIKPKQTWDGKDKTLKFEIIGMADLDYAKCPVTRRSVSGYGTFLEGVPITMKNVMQKIVALSVTEAEMVAGVQCVQDTLCIKRVLECMGLHIDNSNAVDLVNNWSAGSRTRHVDMFMFSLRDIKEVGIIE